MDTKIEKFKVRLPAGSLSQKIDANLQSITSEMNRTPLRVNHKTWVENRKKQVQVVLEKLAICCQTCGNPAFMPNSSANCVKEITKLGIELNRTTKGGAISCNKEVLESIQGRHPLIGQIMDARHAISTLSQLQKWEEYAVAGSVQCTWDQNGTPMGRYTAAGPNLQNRVVPIRETVEPWEGWSFLSLDLGTAEYVTWGALSGDPVMKDCFEAGQDFHSLMGEAVLELNPGLDLHQETSRSFGKTINFAILYRMMARTLASKLGVPIEVAASLISAYFTKVKVAHDYEENYMRIARDTQSAQTKFGRTREIPELKSSNKSGQHEAEKTAWHHHVCGTTAEILKLKTLRVMKAMEDLGLAGECVKVALNMHDELILMVRDDQLETVVPAVVKVFEAKEPWDWSLPYRVVAKVGKNWLETSK